MTLVVVAGLSFACSGGNEHPNAPGAGGGNSGGSGGVGLGGGSGGGLGGSSGGGLGGSGGMGGSAGAAGSGQSGGSGGIGTSGAAGSGALGGAGGGTAPWDTECDGPVAFWATGASFAFPTPPNLAKELGALTYDHDTHPISVVLNVTASDATLGASATMQQSSGLAQVFLPGKKPDFVSAKLAAGGFGTTASEMQGWLRVKDQSGFKDIELNGIDLSVTTSNKCSTILALLTTTIPATAGGITLDLPSGSTTVGALAEGGSAVGWNLRMLFAGESTDFDFASL
jgi:hypothetical protein